MGTAQAQDVTLRARSGHLAVSGDLIAYDGETYRLKSQWGDLTVEASAVDCDGPGCPDLMSFAPKLTIALDPMIGRAAMTALVKAYAAQQGLGVTEAEGGIIALDRAGRTELRLDLLALSAPSAEVLASGAADVTLSTDAGRAPQIALIGYLPLRVVTSAKAARQSEALSELATLPQWHGIAQSQLARHALADLGLKAAQIDEMQRHPDHATLARALMADGTALALWAEPELPEGLAEMALQSACGMVLDQSQFGAALGRHPLAQAIYLQSARTLSANARNFLDYLGAEASRSARAEIGLAAPTPALRLPLGAQPSQLYNMIAAKTPEISREDLQKLTDTLSGAVQLGLSIPLTSDGRPDPRATEPLLALQEALAAGQFAESEIMLVGFSDAVGRATRNQTRSLKAAEDIAKLLQPYAEESGRAEIISAFGFGEALPLGCEANAKRQTRRVEVWLRPPQR